MSDSEKENLTKQLKQWESEISYLIYDIQGQYDSYKDNNYVLDGLYAIAVMLSEYRYALTLLERYIATTDQEEKYTYLETFFVFNREANSKLNAAKKQL